MKKIDYTQGTLILSYMEGDRENNVLYFNDVPAGHLDFDDGVKFIANCDTPMNQKNTEDLSNFLYLLETKQLILKG